MSKEILNVSYGSHADQRMDVYFPEWHDAVAPVAFLIHGGGFVAGRKENFTLQAMRMRDEGFITVNLSHRLIELAGFYGGGTLSAAGPVSIAQQLADVDAAVTTYLDHALAWGAGAGPRYMAGHSAGAILAMLYTFSETGRSRAICAAGNWAGVTDLALPLDTIAPFLPAGQKNFVMQVYDRMLGFSPVAGGAEGAKAVSPYWVAQAGGGRPVISVYPEHNVLFRFPGEAAFGLAQTQRFHTLLRSQGMAETLRVYAGSDHNFYTPADAWQRCIAETAAFFRAH